MNDLISWWFKCDVNDLIIWWFKCDLNDLTIWWFKCDLNDLIIWWFKCDLNDLNKLSSNHQFHVNDWKIFNCISAGGDDAEDIIHQQVVIL